MKGLQTCLYGAAVVTHTLFAEYTKLMRNRSNFYTFVTHIFGKNNCNTCLIPAEMVLWDIAYTFTNV